MYIFLYSVRKTQFHCPFVAMTIKLILLYSKWKREKKNVRQRETEQHVSSSSAPFLLSVTLITLWIYPQLIFQHAWEYLSKYYQALWGSERAWNGPLIAHGYYFPLLFLNLQVQSVTDVERGGRQPQESLLSLKQKQRPKWGGNPINPQAKVAPNGMDTPHPHKKKKRLYISEEVIQLYTTPCQARGLLTECCQNVTVSFPDERPKGHETL